jgi:outer membrane protein assembly factor BamB
MRSPLIPSFLILNIFLTCQAFKDPAPPSTFALVETMAPAPVSYPELTFHNAPKPLSPSAVTADWSYFLGPTHNAYSPETHLLKEFPETGPPKVWEVSRGDGYASAAVIGERTVIFHRSGNQETVECLQLETGKRFWKYTYDSHYKDRYGFGNGPRCQPVSDGIYVYTLGVEAQLHCLELTTGRVLWKRNLKEEFDLTLDFFGVGGAPLLEDNLLIINVGAPDGPSVAAFDKFTGKMVWGSGDQWGPSYASPIPADTINGRRIFVFAGGESRPATGGLMVIDPKTGKEDFTFPWRGGRYESVNASSPVVADNKIYISECYGAGGICFEIQENGSYQELWRNEILNTHFMTAIQKEGYLYGVDGHGPRNAPIVCIELATGKLMWKHEPEWMAAIESPDGPQSYNLSPALASFIEVDGRCLVLGQYGHLAWIDLNPKGYKELSLAHLFMARQTWAMPALSQGLLIVGQNDEGLDGSSTRFICYDLRAGN